MNATRTNHVATYLYPGSFFPEETNRAIPEPTLAAAVAAAPTDEEGYFRKDGWYAVRVTTTTLKRFVADDGEETWVPQDKPAKVGNWIVGERVHFETLPDDDRHSILRSNIRANTKSGYGVLTRCGNWQFADDYDAVIEPAAVAS